MAKFWSSAKLNLLLIVFRSINSLNLIIKAELFLFPIQLFPRKKWHLVWLYHFDIPENNKASCQSFISLTKVLAAWITLSLYGTFRAWDFHGLLYLTSLRGSFFDHFWFGVTEAIPFSCTVLSIRGRRTDKFF